MNRKRLRVRVGKTREGFQEEAELDLGLDGRSECQGRWEGRVGHPGWRSGMGMGPKGLLRAS